jgi:cytochrome c oxidase subunit 2
MNALSILAQASGAAPGSRPAITSYNPLSAEFWFKFVGASDQAIKTEWLFMYIMWVNIISFVLLMILTGWFVFRYRRSRENEAYQVSASHNTPLELAWSIIPLLVMVPIFYYGFTGYVDKLAAPSDSEVINIVGQKWSWRASYRNGGEPREFGRVTRVEYDVPEIFVPAGRPVKLIMTSDDVIHSFYIPDFRTKMDVIPNRYTSMWFLPEADKAGQVYKVFCAEYCGQNHSEMAALIRVLPPAEFERMIYERATGPDAKWTLAEWGRNLWKSKGCAGCHSIDGTDGTGPSWLNYFGNEHEYTDGSRHVADAQWVSENILNSQKYILKGRPSSMPNYQGLLKPMELKALVIFIQSLSDKKNQADIDAAESAYDAEKKAAAAAKAGAPAPPAPPAAPASPN